MRHDHGDDVLSLAAVHHERDDDLLLHPCAVACTVDVDAARRDLLGGQKGATAGRFAATGGFCLQRSVLGGLGGLGGGSGGGGAAFLGRAGRF